MMKDGAMSLPESQEEESSLSQNMQMELHSKGAVLTKAWSDLFSFITKYQAELIVKENTMEIAEHEIDVRKKQLEEMKPVMEAGNEEIDNLQEEIRTKERLLSKAQSEFGVQGQMLQQVQADLNCNVELLDQTRSDLLDRQTELIRNRGDLERLKSELTIKQEQIQIKDNLLKKIQNQLMKENAELKEQLELEKRKFEMEHRSHELTKRSQRENSIHSNMSTKVIEIPDSPPTLDLSVEQSDVGLSEIISAAEAQSKSMGRGSRHTQTHSMSNSLQNFPSHYSNSQSMKDDEQSTWPVISPSVSSSNFKRRRSHSEGKMSFQSPQHTENFDMNNSAASDVFFPLSVTNEDNKSAIDRTVGNMMTNSEMGDVGMLSSAGSSEEPVPISGPIPSVGIQHGVSSGEPMHEGADGMFAMRNKRQRLYESARNRLNESAGNTASHSMFMEQANRNNLNEQYRTDHSVKPFRCSFCSKRFAQKSCLTRHIRIHTGEKPFVCKTCGRGFAQVGNLYSHRIVHLSSIAKQKLN